MRAYLLVERSRSAARSGIRPRNQKSSEVVKYVETAKTSHISGDLNCGQIEFVEGYGKSQYKANHGLPVWSTGKMAACITAKIVIASAKRLIEVRHFCWKRS